MKPEISLTEVARTILGQQPFSRLLGAEMVELRPGYCEIALPLRAELLQQNGFAHGGVLSYLADNALTFAGGSHSLGARVLTSEFKINYLRPAVGDRLVARADSLYAGKSQAVCRCDIYAIADGEEKLCATAQGTIALN